MSHESLPFPLAGNQSRFRAGVAALRRAHPELSDLLGGEASNE